MRCYAWVCEVIRGYAWVLPNPISKQMQFYSIKLFTENLNPMFVKDSTKGALAYNVLILMAIVIISVIIALAFVTFKPKGTAGNLKATLDLGAKKAPTATATTTTATANN